jgi:hypothetical protein
MKLQTAACKRAKIKMGLQVLKIKYNKKHQAVFDKLILFIIKSFSCNLYML